MARHSVSAVNKHHGFVRLPQQQHLRMACSSAARHDFPILGLGCFRHYSHNNQSIVILIFPHQHSTLPLSCRSCHFRLVNADGPGRLNVCPPLPPPHATEIKSPKDRIDVVCLVQEPSYCFFLKKKEGAADTMLHRSYGMCEGETYVRGPELSQNPLESHKNLVTWTLSGRYDENKPVTSL